MASGGAAKPTRAARRWLTGHFYRLFRALGEINLPEGAGDFRLLDRVALDALKSLRERARFSKGLYAWIGFKSVGVPFAVAERHSGDSKFSYRKLTRFAFDGIVSFTTVPLKVWTYVGTIIAAFALVNAVYYMLETLIWGVSVPGFASLIVSITFFAGVQLISLGVLGEYIGRIFAEVKGRPLYVVAEKIDGVTPAASPEATAKQRKVLHSPGIDGRSCTEVFSRSAGSPCSPA